MPGGREKAMDEALEMAREGDMPGARIYAALGILKSVLFLRRAR
jgi:hypothetical protein